MAKKTATLPLAASTFANGSYVTAEQALAGLPSGVYGIISTEAVKLGAPTLINASGTIVSYNHKDNWQIQEFHPLWGEGTFRRQKYIDTWGDWHRIKVADDTGWRNVRSLLDPTAWGLPAAHPYLQVRRVGDRVTIRARLTAAAANPSGTPILTIPPGFRPVSTYNILGTGLLSDVMVAITNMTDPTSLSLRVAAAKDTWLAFEINFATTSVFPTPAEYPGTPA